MGITEGGKSIGIFVTALWGDDIIERRGKALDDIRRLLTDEFQVNRLWLAYGRNNLEWLQDVGVDADLAHEDSVVDWDGVGKRTPEGHRNDHNYGYSMWRHKLHAMEIAMQRSDTITWLDADTHLQKLLPDDFWRRLRQGMPIQMPLTSYHRITCTWRGRQCRRSVPEGAFIYLRDRRILETAKAIYRKNREWVDQTVFAYVIDMLVKKHGPNVFTDEGYKSDGFQPYCVRIYNQFWQPEEEVFAVSRGPGHTRWLGKDKRRQANRERRGK